MEAILAGLNWEICLIYLDDIIIHGRTFEEMLSNLDRVLNKLQEAGLKLKARKCQLFQKEVEYLGHVVSSDGIRTDPKKIEAVQNWPTPENVTELRAFIGLCSYYRRFIQGFADIAKPLHRLTGKEVLFNWTKECEVAFQTLKHKLCETPILAHPDFSKEFILDTDASDFAIGAVLSQVFDGQERVISYASKTLSKSERRYCVTRKELLALVHFVKYFRHYLYGKKFTIRTDHGSLRWLMKSKNPEGQVARWLEELSSFDMNIVHRPGRAHRNADGISRIRCKQCGMDIEQSGKQAGEQEQNDLCKSEMIAHITESEIGDIKTIQDSDSELSEVKRWVESEERPNKYEVQGKSYFVRSLMTQWDRLKVENGILSRKWTALETNEVRWQAIVPLSYRRLVLKFSHDIKTAGHLGIAKTYSKISQGYYWPGLRNDVKAYVNGCEFCARRKDPLKTKKAPMELVRSGFPMERIAIDILGELPVTEEGNRYILVIGDYFTKWTECHAMQNMEASTVAHILVEQVVSRFGIPYTIHSDQGRQFESRLFKEMCKLLQITKTRTTPYHPKSDGMVERFNKTLVTMLSAFVNEHQTDWDKHLQYVMMAYRSTEHETTGLTPNMCMLGRETTCPLDLMFEMPQAIKTIPSNEWVWQLQEKLETAHRFVRENTGRNMHRQKRYHDENLSYETFEVGDKVYVFFAVKKVGCSPKFTLYWRGPFEIKGKLSASLYKVNCGRQGITQVIHCDRIRKAKKQTLAWEESTGNNEANTPEENSERDVEDDRIWTESDIPIINDSAEYEIDFGRGKRLRNRPNWMKDYILSIFRRAMAKTKKTPRKQPHKCDACGKLFETKKASKYHMLTEHVGEIGCSVCLKSFSKKFYFDKHMEKFHSDLEKDSKTQKDTEEPEKDQKPVKEFIKEQGEASGMSKSNTFKDSDTEGDTKSQESEYESSSEEETQESDWDDIEEIQLIEEEKISEDKEKDIEDVPLIEEKMSEHKEGVKLVETEKITDSNNNSVAPVKSRSVMNEEELVGKCDERRVREVYAGRMISKPTRPRPVYTPSRKRAERGTMTDQLEKEKDSESDVDEVTVVMKS